MRPLKTKIWTSGSFRLIEGEAEVEEEEDTKVSSLEKGVVVKKSLILSNLIRQRVIRTSA